MNGHIQAFERVLARAPSVFANQPHGSRSDRYQYVPTIKMIEGLADHGWYPTQAMEQRVRDRSRAGFAKHVIRLQNDHLPTIRETAPQILLTNSHDGTCAYQMRAGFYRFVCSNGLVVGEDILPTLRVKHSGEAIRNIIEGSYRVIQEVPALVDSIDTMGAIELSDTEKRIFARAALAVRFPDTNSAPPINEEQALRPRRYDDNRPDLWSTFNVLQENLTKGGLIGHDANNRRRRTRAVKGIDGNIALNQALWTLAEEMRQHKNAH